jgi:hypothetical protein
MTTIKEQPLPKWFTGMLYTNGDTVTNPFSGESYELSPAELSIYDFIMGSQMMMERGHHGKKLTTEFHKALTWFRKANPEAYMVLLD